MAIASVLLSVLRLAVPFRRHTASRARADDRDAIDRSQSLHRVRGHGGVAARGAHGGPYARQRPHLNASQAFRIERGRRHSYALLSKALHGESSSGFRFRKLPRRLIRRQMLRATFLRCGEQRRRRAFSSAFAPLAARLRTTGAPVQAARISPMYTNVSKALRKFQCASDLGGAANGSANAPVAGRSTDFIIARRSSRVIHQSN